MTSPSRSVDKNQIALRDFALRYPGAHEDFPWGERVVKVLGEQVDGAGSRASR